MSSEGLPRAYGEAVLSATIRSQPEDFFVEEIDAFTATGAGEHLLLSVEKRAMTTQHAAQRLADWAGVEVGAIGYAGMKDRHAVTRQRFSVHLPGRQAPPLEALVPGSGGAVPGQRMDVLADAWHARKLTRGAHGGNRFRLVLRDVEGNAAAIETRLQAITATGVPNYFGGQRFGHGGGNVDKAIAMFAGRRVRREERTHLLSSARSALFNRVLAARVRDGSWNRGLEGELWMLDGSRSVFGPEPWSDALAERLAAFDIHPSAPLWGQGALRTTADARALEESALGDAESAALQRGIEHAGMRQERRATRLHPREMYWTWQDGGMLISFLLPPGAYATALLAEMGDLRDVGAAQHDRSSD
ncbi:MAG: tRNA pseudouridine(13) synthase TruD [Luteimonas sp.]